MLRLGIIVGSTRPNRRAPKVAQWVQQVVAKHPKVAAAGDEAVSATLIDLIDHPLPMLDEPIPAVMKKYGQAHTQRWSQTIDALDGFIFITPEYNHAPPASLKNAIDYLFHEWSDKAGAFVSYGGMGGIRAVEHLRLVLAEVKMATTRTQVAFSRASDPELFTAPEQWKPSAAQEGNLHKLLDELIAWSAALKTLRVPPAH